MKCWLCGESIRDGEQMYLLGGNWAHRACDQKIIRKPEAKPISKGKEPNEQVRR
jgi:hypothetical protein